MIFALNSIGSTGNDGSNQTARAQCLGTIHPLSVAPCLHEFTNRDRIAVCLSGFSYSCLLRPDLVIHCTLLLTLHNVASSAIGIDSNIIRFSPPHLSKFRPSDLLKFR